jgi:hypothetical protein
MLNQAPIVAILTLQSDNPKTGNMAQVWILPADMAPHDAVKTGADSSVCGDCKHRRGNGGACYVTPFQGPLSVFKAWQKGAYPIASQRILIQTLAGRHVRLGAYGDPAALPAGVLLRLTGHAAGWTGYTHAWRTLEARARSAAEHCDSRNDPIIVRSLCMASCDTVAEAEEAQALGWRTFRVHGAADAAPVGRESVCPASDEAGHKLTCIECGVCSGTGGKGRGSIRIAVHGSLASRFEAARR